MIDPDSIRADHAPGIRSIVGPWLQALAD